MKMKDAVRFLSPNLVVMLSLVSAPAMAWAGARGEPQCVVTTTTQIHRSYGDGSEEVTRSTIPIRWVPELDVNCDARAEADLPGGGRTELRVAPGYGMRFHTLSITAADGRKAQVRTTTPCLDHSVPYASVSTSLELLNETHCRPGGSIYCSIRKVSAECFFNPLMYKESE